MGATSISLSFPKYVGGPFKIYPIATSTRRPSLSLLYPGFSLKTLFFYVSFGTCLIQSRCPNAPLPSDRIVLVASYSTPRYLKGSLRPRSGWALEVVRPVPSFYWWEGGNSERERAQPDNLGGVGESSDSSSRLLSTYSHSFSHSPLPPLCCSFEENEIGLCWGWGERGNHTQKRTNRTVRSQGLNSKSKKQLSYHWKFTCSSTADYHHLNQGKRNLKWLFSKYGF